MGTLAWHHHPRLVGRLVVLCRAALLPGAEQRLFPAVPTRGSSSQRFSPPPQSGSREEGLLLLDGDPTASCRKGRGAELGKAVAEKVLLALGRVESCRAQSWDVRDLLGKGEDRNHLCGSLPGIWR